MNIKDFDIELYLNEMAINYKLHGKNIGVNEIGICCPYCSDTSYHLNINIVSLHNIIKSAILILFFVFI